MCRPNILPSRAIRYNTNLFSKVKKMRLPHCIQFLAIVVLSSLESLLAQEPVKIAPVIKPNRELQEERSDDTLQLSNENDSQTANPNSIKPPNIATTTPTLTSANNAQQVVAPPGNSLEASGIRASIEELKTRIADHNSQLKELSSAKQSHSTQSAELTGKVEQLKLLQQQAQFDLANANERASISARAANNRNNLRTAYDYTHSGRAITSPLHSVQTARNERTGERIRMMDSLPGPQDPNDLLNPSADGTSSLTSFQLVPFWRTTAGSAQLTRADHTTVSSSTDGTVRMFGESDIPQDPYYFNPNPQAAEATASPKEDAPKHTLDFGFQIRPGMFFDTGYTGGNNVFSPANIELSHSDKSHSNSQLFYNAGDGTNSFLIPYRPQIGYSMADTGSGSVTAHADAISLNGNNLNLRTAALRYLDTSEEIGMGFGKMETLFGDLGTAAGTSISGALPVGTVSTGLITSDPATGNLTGGYVGVEQLRFMRYWHNARYSGDVTEWSLSLENQQYLTNKFIPANVGGESNYTVLNRYPTIVNRLRYGGSNGFNSVQIAGLLSPVGFDSKLPANNFHEAFDMAMGVSTNARFELGNNCLKDTVYFGAVGGQGIGGYIFGNLPGAVLTPTKTGLVDDIRLLTAVGGYASYRHVLVVYDNGSSWSSNLMGGIAQASNSRDSIPSDLVNRQLSQIGVNLLWKNSNSLIGIEYQYGSRLVQDGTVADNFGDNHRISFALQFSGLPGSLTPAGGRALTSRSSLTKRATADDFNSAARDSRSSKKSRLRF